MVVAWDEMAQPLLKALSETQDRNVRDGILHLGRGDNGAKTLGLTMSDDVVHDALLALEDAGYVHLDRIEYASGGSASVLGARVTGRGMQALGQWPSLQTAMSPATLNAVLRRLQDYAVDEQTREDLLKAEASVKRSAGVMVRDAVATFGAEALKIKLGLK